MQEKNLEITDCINYAKRIQSAILPDSDFLKKHFQDSFILYKPKDIVAGDFYWSSILNDNLLFAVADCTGHGVPGALVSVVCSNCLNSSLKELETANPSEIMERTREMVKESLHSNQDNVMDGMDIALCSLNLKTNELLFNGANNPIWIIRDGNLIEIKGDKQPVGKYYLEKAFTQHTFQLKKGDCIYLTTDGYADQFGGPKGKKFMYKPLKQQLLAIHAKPALQQKEILDKSFDIWRGALEQIDDVCIIGVRV